jgi:tetratricopeptide (TPR) repeat protein
MDGLWFSVIVVFVLVQVFARMEDDLEEEAPGLVRHVLCFLAVTRRGLTESELRKLVEAELSEWLVTHGFPAMTFASLMLQLHGFLTLNQGVRSFGHKALSEAVAKRYFKASASADRSEAFYRRRLAVFLRNKPLTSRQMLEYPYNLYCLYHLTTGDRADLLEQLHAFIFLPAVLRRLRVGSIYSLDLLLYIRLLRSTAPASSPFDPVSEFGRAIAAFGDTALAPTTDGDVGLPGVSPRSPRQPVHPPVGDLYESCANWCVDVAGLLTEVAPLYHNAIAARSLEGSPLSDIARLQWLLANVYCLQDQFQAAQPYAQQALVLLRAYPQVQFLCTHSPALVETLASFQQVLTVPTLQRQTTPLDLLSSHPQIELLTADSPVLSLARQQSLSTASMKMKTAPILSKAKSSVSIENTEKNMVLFTLFGKCLDTYAAVMDGLGQAADALTIYGYALTLQVRLCGEKDVKAAAVRNNMANVLMNMHEYRDAEVQYEQCLAVYEEKRGADDFELANVLSSYASCLHQLKSDHELTTRCWKRALAIKESKLGPQHISLVKTLGNFAMFYVDALDYPTAIELLERALRIREESLGKSHIQVVHSLNNLGQVCMRQRAFDAAAVHLQRAWTILEASQSRNADDWLPVLSALATLAADQNRINESVVYLTKKLEFLEVRLAALLSPLESTAVAAAAAGTHPAGWHSPAIRDVITETRATMSKLTLVEQERNAHSAALTVCQRWVAFEQRPVVTATSTPACLADAWMNTGPCHFALGDIPSAKAAFEQALLLRRVTVPVDVAAVAEAEQWLQDCQ